jgi:hypothetical protein
MALTKLERMERDLDELLQNRAHFIRQYDRSRDGSEEKRNAIEALNRLGPKITHLEALIEKEVEDETTT